jgi:RNA polymerase-binding protein DksA
VTKTFVKKMKRRLEDMKRDILQQLSAENEEFRKLAQSEDRADLVDVATGDIDRSMLQALGAVELKRLRLIEAALGRIEEGRYGLCLKTGKPIPQERLEAIPYALYRIEVQNEMERHHN